MESRKRSLSSPKSELLDKKRQKEKSKENTSDGDSDNSFENFSVSTIRSSAIDIKEKDSPRSRSKRILVEERDDDDSFDAPLSDSKPIIILPKLSKKDSGVAGFPCLFDDDIVVYLTVDTLSRRDGSLDLECKDKNGKTRMVYLQDRWSELPVEEGNAINLISAKVWGDGDFIVDEEQGIVVLNPNALVPCTSVASATFCSRKTILNDKFKFGNASNKAMLLGTIMHEIFQNAITSKKRPITDSDLLKIWKTQAPKYAEELVALSFTPNCLNSELQPYFSIICAWINKHYPNSKSFFGKRELLPSKSELLEVHDIEENIWDPRLGLKGKVDVTMRTKQKQGMESLELKTGKSSFSSEHIGQVLLYCMMHSSRYEQPIGPGNILYLKDGAARCVTPRAAELFGIIQQRNNLSVFFENPTSNTLPAPRADTRFCEKCDHKVMCSFYQKTEEKYAQSSGAMKTFAEGEIAHLQQKHIEYTSNWIRWITAEWQCERERTETQNKDLWLKSVQERVEGGTCLAGLTPIGEEVSNSQRVLISFRRETPSVSPFHAGDVCLLSNQKHISISFVIVDQVSDDVVRVSADKSVKNDVIGLRLRSVLVDLLPPQIVVETGVDLPAAVRKIIVRAKLNTEQRLAVVHALATQDFMMVEGLPGSGKTTLISVLIQCLVATNKKILLAAFTHSAVDNILGKLKNDVSTEKILRLGNSSSIKEDIQRITLKAKVENEATEDYYDAVKRIMKTTPIVACTCHHVPRELLFSYRHFDVVIVDEASMVLEPLLIPVLATSKKFVLVGDCKQLTPLVVSKKAKFEGAGVSTMEKLQKAHPKAVLSLTSQYRMNKELSVLSSKLFYEDRLICGNEAVARSCLSRMGDYALNEDMEDHLKKCLSGEMEDSCVFLDTQSGTRRSMQCEDGEGGGVVNEGEARVVVEMCAQFIEGGIKPHEIGVMSAYRKQAELIRNLLKNDALEVNTVDSYQGREKRVMIWSLTWTENSTKKSELLKDERRVNVALTRARQKLVVIGCKKSAETISVLFRFSQILANHVTLPN
ncbi:unnamed protein product [Caenorhabditis sp. 36 PRJEB53466]|nr:unnamed protein product [Caenorhabditis sp. 36 PRJEB53466]